MPSKAELDRRGGLVRVRTEKLPNGKYRHIYIVRNAGKRGGHTIAGETRTNKRSR